MLVEFPSVAGGLPRHSMFKRYYETYYRFFLKIFEYTGAAISYVNDTAVADGAFTSKIDKNTLIFDYSDHLRVVTTQNNLKCFKCHYSEGETFFNHENSIDAKKKHTDYPLLFPFSPISFYDWQIFTHYRECIAYRTSPVSNLIVCRQLPYGNALTRRKHVQGILRKEYGDYVVTSIVSKENFWFEISSCMCAVFVPGSRNDMLDRGHIQYLAFGCCTISPPIINILPFNKKLIPDVHYLACKPDYSDLLDKIEFARTHIKLCKEIGSNAKKLFMETCIPYKLMEWVNACINSDSII